MKERPCKNCGKTPLNHSAIYMDCPYPETGQYEPDPTKPGTIPCYKPKVRKVYQQPN